MKKLFLAAAFLAAVSIPASAGGRVGGGHTNISDQASVGNRAGLADFGTRLKARSFPRAGHGFPDGQDRTISRFPNPNGSIYDRWGNTYRSDNDARRRTHNYRGIVTLVR
jgi:hypothetical protein